MLEGQAMQRQHVICQITEFDRLCPKCMLDIQIKLRCQCADRMVKYYERVH